MNDTDTNNHNQITDTMLVDICTGDRPAYIYLSIGCAQGWHSPETQQPQQYPPQIAALPGRKLCILIDPQLESPPVSVKTLDPAANPADTVYVINPNLTFVVIRRNFIWPELSLMNRLYALCTQTRLIVQDFTGEIIDRYYPKTPGLLRNVLFDYTYNDGGCFIDFSKISILQRPDGSFIQPAREPIADVHPFTTPEQLAPILKARTDILFNYVQRLYRIQTNTEPFRDWCTPDVVARYADPLFAVYGIPPATDTGSLERLMLAAFADLSAAADDHFDPAAALTIIRYGGKDYETALRVLRDILAPK